MVDSAALLEGLDEEQQMGRHRWVRAAAGAGRGGTGKTRTLVAWARWLAGQGMDPGRILLPTFTRRSAADMLARAAPPDGGGRRIRGGTFHATAHPMSQPCPDPAVLRLVNAIPGRRSVLP